MRCLYCERAAVAYTVPALCEVHLDLAILVEYLVEQKGP